MAEDERQRLSRLKSNLQRRALICRLIRAFFQERGFLEVETPLRVPAIAPERYIAPFQSEGWFLSTSPELHMKRMLSAGYDKLFQMTRSFRKGERGRWHNPEFTMLEWYRCGADYNRMIRDVEQMVAMLAAALGFGNTIQYRGQGIDVSLPWPRTAVRKAFLDGAGWDPVLEPDCLRFDTDFVSKVIPGLQPARPTVLFDYPAAMAALARLKPEEPGVAERAEVFIGGLELANIYSELCDPAEQKKRFLDIMEHLQQEHGQELTMPGRFLETMAYLPECGGVALGVDRLVMLLCDAGSIDEVIAFASDRA